jgi:hypothetical protein
MRSGAIVGDGVLGCWNGMAISALKYSCSHVQQGGGEPEGFPKVSLSPLIFVLSLLAKTILA